MSSLPTVPAIPAFSLWELGGYSILALHRIKNTQTMSSPATYRRALPISWFHMRTIFIFANYTLADQLFKTHTQNSKFKVDSFPSLLCDLPQTLNTFNLYYSFIVLLSSNSPAFCSTHPTYYFSYLQTDPSLHCRFDVGEMTDVWRCCHYFSEMTAFCYGCGFVFVFFHRIDS